MSTRKSIINKTLQVSGSTLLSRLLGIIREVLMVKYLGASAISDAFLTAYKIPNSLRKIFAEGALSAAFIPTIVQVVRQKGRSAVNSLITLGFLVFEGMVLVLCVLIMWQAEFVLRLIAPGFSEQQIINAIPYLQILMPFIFFLSSSALLTGALQSVGHFFVPAFSPVLLNIVFIGALIICKGFNLPVTYLCWFILFGGFLQLIAHIITYFSLHFSFGRIQKKDLAAFGVVLGKFGLCLPSVSIMEVSLFIDTSFASYLPDGSISLINYANRFMGIPLGVFAVAFSTVLLPHFSRVSAYAPKRLQFYLLESIKLVWWVTLPVSLLMIFFADKIFLTIFLSKITLAQAYEASHILIAFVIGLFFFALNKILLNVYYALHVTWVPGVVSLIATVINIGLNWLLMPPLQSVGLALATTISTGFVQTLLLLAVLYWQFNFNVYPKQLALFIARYSLQVIVLTLPFLGFYFSLLRIMQLLPEDLANFFVARIGFWFWVGPLACLYMVSLWYLRSYFKVRLYFID